ncbi:MAG: hypothetical protein PHU43_03640 [Candidatus Bipolaricaulis sp.]|nr:hypothetical protein [Candidatus Bipolaricaulis sp.]
MTSSVAGWTLDYALAFSIPSQVTQAVAAVVSHLTFGGSTALSGIPGVDVTYACGMDLEGFAGLPQGARLITIGYTVAIDRGNDPGCAEPPRPDEGCRTCCGAGRGGHGCLTPCLRGALVPCGA